MKKKISFTSNILFYASSIVIIIILLYMLFDDEKKHDENENEKHDEMKKYFVTFGDTESRFNNSRMRIISEAIDLNYFDGIFGYSEKSPELLNFFQEHKNFFETHKRGYGYWIWKFYIVLETFKKINYGDVILYADSGCSLLKNGNKRLDQYIKLASSNKLVVFRLSFSFTKESNYTKGDVLDETKCDEQCCNSNQIMAGAFIVKKCPEMEIFFESLYKMCIKYNYKLITDEPSKIPNKNGFVENRHDQSIFSTMIKTKLVENVDVIILGNEVDIIHHDGSIFPIIATRK